jgi:hypothetical protein
MMPRVLKMLSGAVAAAAGLYGGYVLITFARFGRLSGKASIHPLLDQLMPEYAVRERHSIRVPASAEITFAAAREISFHDSRLIRMIFALREMPGRLSGGPPAPTERRPVIDEVVALGWRQLAEVPRRQVVMGAMTQPWKQTVQFRGLSADEFVAFCEPGYAKIAWTIEAEPAGSSTSVFSTETRVMTTDPVSRERFRRYWAFLSPGILIIRYEILRLVRTEASRRAATAVQSTRPFPT